MKQLIAIKKLQSIVLAETAPSEVNRNLLLSFNAELMNLGYTLSEESYNAIKNTSNKTVSKLFVEVIPVLKEMKGDNVRHKPMYPNYPQQVMEASLEELYINAIVHYWSHGKWQPTTELKDRNYAFEIVNFKEISIATEESLNEAFYKMTSSNDSLSEEDKSFLKYFIVKKKLDLPKEIPFKETMCYVASLALKEGLDIKSFIKTTTDVLRVITALSEGDISLASSTRFKSLAKSKRRMFVSILEDVISEEDVKRHEKKWKRLFHNLHVGDFKAEKVNAIAKKVRSGEKLSGFNSEIESLLENKDYSKVASLLEDRAGDFARRIHNILGKSNDTQKILKSFEKVVDKVPTRILIQLLGATKARQKNVDTRVIFPKGQTQKAVMVRKTLPELRAVNKLLKMIKVSLYKRFENEESLGKVYIDPQLFKAQLPTQQRSASSGAFNVARGTKIPIKGDKNTLRFFIYWKGQDIDLSATLHDENFKLIEHISYTNLKSENYEACHSGDITYAPNGASEFIDITMDKALNFGARYVVMNVLVYSGPSFSNHETCYAGWMRRDKPSSNEIYEPSTVEQKVNLTINSKRAIPVIFDLKTQEAIWVDISGSTDGYHSNNVENNQASIEEMVEAFQTMDNNKVSLGELLEFHAKARGELVETPEEADNVFSFDKGTPYDITMINSELLK